MCGFFIYFYRINFANMKRKYLLLTFILTSICFGQTNVSLIPMPQNITFQPGAFVLHSKTVIQTNDVTSFEALFLKESIKNQTGLDLKIAKVVPNSAATIQLIFDVEGPDASNFKENYKLEVTPKSITVKAEYNQGIFYGIQTLLQLIPLAQESDIKIPCLQIFDHPKFKWRGMHLDVGRHFFSTAFIKKYIDYIAMYKMNTFHWHLTEDQGWRIEIKKYPKLNQVGAWREGSMVGHYNEQKFDSLRYGGFYTQNEIKEIVAYATARHITIVPEIEMPGHSLAALAAYPELSCTGGPFEVGKKWGVFDDVYCPKEETFAFLENVLTEVMALFPSEYIHIGGDECPKTRWKNCPHCQKIIVEKGLKDEHELQSYFIQRIEKFVNSKGRKIIGWDEILEGGLAPNAAVMSWRGTEGGIAAAKEKHFVVMTPGSHCYFDHYQGEPKNEPIAIGGYTNVEKVYAFNPIPKELTSEEATYILGAQANVWTEYMNTPEHVEYMTMPRMAALSEVLWGTSNTEKYKDFEKRLIQHFSVYDHKKINYSKALFEVTTKVHPAENGVAFELQSVHPKGIKYTTDGTAPTAASLAYEKPILITANQTIKAAYFENDKPKSATIEQLFSVTKSTGKKIELLHQPHENYGIGGGFTLVDGMKGNTAKFGRDWLGFWGKDMNATIDLEASRSVSKVEISTLSAPASWIYYPKNMTIWVSNDGKNFEQVSMISSEEIERTNGKLVAHFENIKAQWIKVIAKNNGIIYDGNPGAGSNSWLFVDEISVE
jgi:hexosaminidase